MCSRNCCLALGLNQYHRPTAYRVGVCRWALFCASTLMIVSHKPVSSTFVCLCFVFSPNVLNLSYQNQNLFFGVKKHVQSIKTKFFVAKIANSRMLRILEKKLELKAPFTVLVACIVFNSYTENSYIQTNYCCS